MTMRNLIQTVLVVSLIAICATALSAQDPTGGRGKQGRLDPPHGGTPAPLVPLLAAGAGALYFVARSRRDGSAQRCDDQAPRTR